jgi:hypothetical protein
MSVYEIAQAYFAKHAKARGVVVPIRTDKETIFVCETCISGSVDIDDIHNLFLDQRALMAEAGHGTWIVVKAEVSGGAWFVVYRQGIFLDDDAALVDGDARWDGLHPVIGVRDAAKAHFASLQDEGKKVPIWEDDKNILVCHHIPDASLFKTVKTLIESWIPAMRRAGHRDWAVETVKANGHKFHVVYLVSEYPATEGEPAGIKAAKDAYERRNELRHIFG